MKSLRLPLVSAALAAVLLSVAGCAQSPPRVEIQRVNIAVPVACDEPEPVRPTMPTEHLAGDADLDTWAKSVIAEIERREGYEEQLREGLRNCKRPLNQGSQSS